MAEQQNIIPDEYKGSIMKEFDGDAYIQQRIADAVKKATTRTESYPKPKWWDEVKNGYWLDCIATALSNYHNGDIPTGNGTFKDKAMELGFAEYTDPSQLKAGDIIQYREPDGTPFHSVMFIDKDEDGKNRVAYSNGAGLYHQKAYYDGESRGYIPHYYRYIGTPAELKEIEDHNAAVRKKNMEVFGNEQGIPQRIQTPVQGLKVQPIRKPTIFDVARGAE